MAVQVTRRAVVHGRQSDANRLEDLEEQLVGVLETLNPEVADRVPRDWDTRLVDLRPDGKLARSLRAADTLARYWLVLAVATATWHLLWILSSADRHRTLTRAAFLSLFAGSMILAAASFGRIAVGHGFDSGTAAAIRATYDEFAGGAKSTAYAIVASSVVVIAASTAGLPGLRTAGVLRWVVRVVRLPRNPIGQVCVAVASASAGTLLVAIAPAIAVMLVRLLGVTLAYLGVGLIARSLPEAEPAALGATRRYSRRYLVGVVATAVIAVPGLVWARSARTAAAGDSDLRCNGSADLCDRRVDQVAFAGAHNAMASPEAGFLLASQTGTIAAQLRGGIRALLLDSTYGIATSTGVVWTDATTLDVQSQLADRLDPDTLATAESLRKNLLPPARDPDVYLCHAACEIGATLAVDAFRDVRLFLEQNPSEIVLLILQDSTSDSDTIGAIRRARLDQFAYTHEAGDPWPTLAQLIRQATPLIVMSER
ncbi:MAG: hypothetical protein OEW30_19885, partial [Acidimicrobiia bacterium]|nr:hypothetical protein [Acidimicrobiia bacterium]